MSWRVEFSKIGERDLAKLDRSVRQNVIVRLQWLSENFDTAAPLSLHGEWGNFFKLRVGDWRVVYTFDPTLKLITVRVIDHRSKIYKRKI